MVIPLVSPGDLAGELMMIGSFEILLRHTCKPVGSPPAENPNDVRFLTALAACCGGMEQFRRHPTTPIMVSPISPLEFSEGVTGAIVAVAESGAPFFALPAPSMGATGPVTMAGVLAQQHAEVLAAMLIAAAARPGVPFGYCSRIMPLDMRTAVAAWGGPEIGLSGAIATQLAHRMGLRCDTYGLATSAPAIDGQFGYERFANAFMPALAGADLLSGVGSIENGMTVSFEAAVMDDELLAMIHHLARGCPVTGETLAFEVMRDTIRGDGMFLGAEHTVEHLRSGALWIPELSVRAGLDEESERLPASERTMLHRAHERMRELLAGHSVDPVPDDVDRELREIMEQARRELVQE
jgi:trimethylamine--corrinoid protein Co-methyltransferase